MREYASTNVTIWQDPDFRALPYPAQMLYFMLWTHPQLSYCGVVDWRPAKLTGSGQGWTKDGILTVAACLEARHFIVIDEDTEECLLRSWVRWDGLMRQPRLPVSFALAYATVGSNLIRGVVIHEMNKLRILEPAAGGWDKPQVKAMFDLPSIDPKQRHLDDPFAEGFELALPSITAKVSTKGTARVSASTTSKGTANPSEEVSAKVSGRATPCSLLLAPNSLLRAEEPASSTLSPVDATFNEFWDAYPKKADKIAAKKAYAKAIKSGATPESLAAAAARYARSIEDPKFTKHPATWLNAGSYLDAENAAPRRKLPNDKAWWDTA